MISASSIIKYINLLRANFPTFSTFYQHLWIDIKGSSETNWYINSPNTRKKIQIGVRQIIIYYSMHFLKKYNSRLFPIKNSEEKFSKQR